MKTSVIEVHAMLSVWSVEEVEKQIGRQGSRRPHSIGRAVCGPLHTERCGIQTLPHRARARCAATHRCCRGKTTRQDGAGKALKRFLSTSVSNACAHHTCQHAVTRT